MEDQQPKSDLINAFAVYGNFCKTLLDSFVVIDTKGKVVRSNPLFGNLIQKTSKEIYKADTLEQLIKFKLDKDPLTLEEMLAHDHPTRIDEVRCEIIIEGSEEPKVLNLILGIYPFKKDGEKLGIFLLIRDVTAESTLQDKYKAKTSLSITDALTGLYNRLFFEQHLPKILEQMIGEGEDYAISVMMVDIDHFKNINDNYGHQAGDHVLEAVGRKIKDTCRKSDIICRYGGEEFLVVLPGADLLDSRVVGEKLRKAVENLEIVFEEKKIKATISVGSAQIRVGMEIAEQAIGRADRALYQAKATGRNKVCLNDNGKIT